MSQAPELGWPGFIIMGFSSEQRQIKGQTEHQATSVTALNLLGRRLGLQASPSLPSLLIGF